jgi:hypothetical protein
MGAAFVLAAPFAGAFVVLVVASVRRRLERRRNLRKLARVLDKRVA